jgi:hypothetical protein
VLGPGLPSAAADSLLVSLFDRDNYAGEVHDGNPWDQTLEA